MAFQAPTSLVIVMIPTATLSGPVTTAARGRHWTIPWPILALPLALSPPGFQAPTLWENTEIVTVSFTGFFITAAFSTTAPPTGRRWTIRRPGLAQVKGLFRSEFQTLD